MVLQYLGVFLVGIMVGFLGGLFGKGGSAIATPLLNLIGIPGFVSVAAPLPATIPGTFIASVEYRKSDLLDWPIIIVSLIAGIPATIAGAFLTGFTGSSPLLIVTGILVFGFGISFVFFPDKNDSKSSPHPGAAGYPSHWKLRLVLVAVFIGLISGLLANSGGFLLAPSYNRILHQPIKKAFACSLFVSMVLAVPGTVTHAMMGHIDWVVAGVLATGSVPFSLLGAKTAIRSDPGKLELWYGIILTALGLFFLAKLFFGLQTAPA
jgi:uncharacterized protein